MEFTESKEILYRAHTVYDNSVFTYLKNYVPLKLSSYIFILFIMAIVFVKYIV